MAYKVLDICTDALFENGAYGIDTPVLSAVDGQMALRWLNRRLDAWAALKRYAYTQTFTQFTLAPNHQPHLIGPGLNAPDFAVTQRPVRIEGAALVLTDVTPNHINRSNKLVIESKEDMRGRGLASPDDADAHCLTFAQEVAPLKVKKPSRHTANLSAWS